MACTIVNWSGALVAQEHHSDVLGGPEDDLLGRNMLP